MTKPAAPAIPAKKTSRTVCVACKIPTGLKLQLQHVMKRRMPTGRGSDNDYQVMEFNAFGGPAYNVFGPAIPALGGVPEGYVMPPDIKGGYAFTPGIPADFWEEWLVQNELADYVVNHMIFALPEMSDSKAKANEQGEITSGLEPLSRAIDEKTGMLKDRRIPKPLNANVGRIAFDTERSARQQSSE